MQESVDDLCLVQGDLQHVALKLQLLQLSSGGRGELYDGTPQTGKQGEQGFGPWDVKGHTVRELTQRPGKENPRRAPLWPE